MQTYAGSRPVHDADSHIMEPADWLARHAEPNVRLRVPRLDLQGLKHEADAALAAHARRPEARRANADENVMARKNWSALGAFDPVDRARAVDLLGFRSQLVFSTYSQHELIRVPGMDPIDEDLLYGMTDAHNRGMVSFCSADPRLLPAGFVALDVPERAIASAELALGLGCAGLEIASYPVGPYSLTSEVYDPIFRSLEAHRRPLLFHVGGGGRLVDPVFANGSPNAQHLMHRHTMLPYLTYLGIPAPLEMALAALVLDGVFERFPRLMCGVIEQGALWLPGFVRRLETAFDQFTGHAERSRLQMRPAEYVFRHLRVTPFAFEDIPWIIEQTGANVLMFGSDYPHDEGGHEPLKSFDRFLSDASPNDRRAVMWRNFEELMGDGLPEPLRVSADDARDAKDDRLDAHSGRRSAADQRRALLGVLARHVAQQLGLDASPAEIQAAIDEFRLEHGLADLQTALAWLAAHGSDESPLVHVMEEEILIGKLVHAFREPLANALDDHTLVASAERRRSAADSPLHVRAVARRS